MYELLRYAAQPSPRWMPVTQVGERWRGGPAQHACGHQPSTACCSPLTGRGVGPAKAGPAKAGRGFCPQLPNLRVSEGSRGVQKVTQVRAIFVHIGASVQFWKINGSIYCAWALDASVLYADMQCSFHLKKRKSLTGKNYFQQMQKVSNRGGKRWNCWKLLYFLQNKTS